MTDSGSDFFHSSLLATLTTLKTTSLKPNHQTTILAVLHSTANDKAGFAKTRMRQDRILGPYNHRCLQRPFGHPPLQFPVRYPANLQEASEVNPSESVPWNATKPDLE